MILEDTKTDFNQKYGDCIVRSSDKGGNTSLYQIHGFEGPDNRLSGHVLNENGSWIPDKRDIADLEFDFTIPPMGMINVDSTVVYMRRTVTKQFRQAFTFKNGVVAGSVIEKHLCALKGVGINIQGVSAVKAVFDPVYYPLEEALELIYSGNSISSAITSRYYVSVSPYLPFVYLGFMGKIIGKIDNRTGGCFLYKEARPLIEDITQYINIAGECDDIQAYR